MDRRAKIIATLGPASSDKGSIRRLLSAGVDVVRLNLSHGSGDEHRRLLRSVRAVASSLHRHVPLLLDLMGPRYRVGTIPEGRRELASRDRVTLGREASDADIPIDSPELLKHLRRGERVLIDNGLVELKVDDDVPPLLSATVVQGGVIGTRKGINLPDSELPFQISDKDRADLLLAIEEGVDFVGASYVGSADDLAALRRELRQAGGDLPLVAKLERGRAVEHIDEIVAAADAVMVARGDLGVEIPLHHVPVLQKRIVTAGRHYGRPVIVATQMLESMVEHSRPTRAESSDVANAIFDGADALMLSAETAVGSHAEKAVSTMVAIIEEAESYRRHLAASATFGTSDPLLGTELHTRQASTPTTPADREDLPAVADAVARSAVFTARHLGVRHIVAFSQSGFTARLIARYRPTVPILAFTTEARVARHVQLLWGVRPMLLDTQPQQHDDVVPLVERHLRTAELAYPGERLIILMGDPIRDRPLTNLMRIHVMGD